MRSIRRKRQIEYETNPQLRRRMKRLAEIREKYKKIIKTKEYASH